MQSPPVERLAESVLNSFLRHCRMREAAARTMIIQAADLADRLFYLVSGSVEVIIEDESGREMILAYLNPGHFFGEMGFFDGGQSTRSAWVLARADCTFAEMGYDTFTQLSRDEPELVVEIAAQLATRLFRTDMKLGDLAFLDVTGRVAHALLELAEEPDAVQVPGGLRVRVTRPQLSRLVGCSREMVCRVLKTLQAQGLIHDTGQGIVIHDEDPTVAMPALSIQA